MFLEPLPVAKTDTGWAVQKEAAALARIAGVASALGDSSRYLWLKLPYCAGYETVARATSLPILLLGGESAGDPAPFLSELASALQAGPERARRAGGTKRSLSRRRGPAGDGQRPWAASSTRAGRWTRRWSRWRRTGGRDLDSISRYF